jgi:hypothetical protein
MYSLAGHDQPQPKLEGMIFNFCIDEVNIEKSCFRAKSAYKFTLRWRGCSLALQVARSTSDRLE